MAKLLRFKFMLLMAMVLMGAGNVWATDATIKFGNATGSTSINDETVSGQDSQKNTWTITTAGTTSFTPNASYSQIGSKNSPATSITFTTTLADNANITAFSAKFGGFSNTEGTVTLKVGEDNVGSGTLNGTSDVTVSASSVKNGKVLTVTVTGISKGVKAYEISYTYSSKTAAGVSATDVEMITGTSKSDFYTGPASGYDGTLSFESDDEEVVKVEDGVLKAIAPGTATVTISADETANYAAVNVSFGVTVKNRDAVAPEGSGATAGYTLVTDASTLKDGDKILLVYGTKAMSAQNGNYRDVTDVTVSSNFIESISDDVQVITLEGSEDAWYFNVGDGYLYASSPGSNNMGTEKDADDNAKATISITDGYASIQFQGTNTRNCMRYNSGSPRFSCYAESSTLAKPQIYRMVAATSFDVTIGETGWRTLVSAKNVSLPTGVKAYIVTESGTAAKLVEVASIKANNPYLLNGPEGSCKLTIIDTPEEPTGNLLAISDESTGSGVFVLANKNNGVGFYKWTGGSIGAGRVYLPDVATARDFVGFVFADETTGINVVKQIKENRAIYNLRGMRVTTPTKGLYIIGGKKVVIK